VRTWPSRRPLFALDRIWVHPPGALASVRAHASATARRASDHLPLVGMIEVAQSEANKDSRGHQKVCEQADEAK
jgi:endonuclease/exonuclease/phosphatase family metal-dependent hydrolase